MLMPPNTNIQNATCPIRYVAFVLWHYTTIGAPYFGRIHADVFYDNKDNIIGAFTYKCVPMWLFFTTTRTIQSGRSPPIAFPFGIGKVYKNVGKNIGKV